MPLISIWGPPHSGKTKTCLELGRAFARNNKSVCIISPLPYSEMTAKLDVKIEDEHSLARALRTPGMLKKIAFPTQESLMFVIASAWDNDAFGDEPNGEALRDVLKQAVLLYDVVLFDCTTAPDDALTARALNMADHVVLLCGASSADVMWFRSFQRAIDALHARSVLVSNQREKIYDYETLYKAIHKIPSVVLPFMALSDTQEFYQSGGKSGKRYTEAINDLMELTGTAVLSIVDANSLELDETDAAKLAEETAGKKKGFGAFLKPKQKNTAKKDDNGEQKAMFQMAKSKLAHKSKEKEEP